MTKGFDKEIATRKSIARMSSFFCHNDMVQEYKKWISEDKNEKLSNSLLGGLYEELVVSKLRLDGFGLSYKEGESNGGLYFHSNCQVSRLSTETTVLKAIEKCLEKDEPCHTVILNSGNKQAKGYDLIHYQKQDHGTTVSLVQITVNAEKNAKTMEVSGTCID